MIIFLRDLVLKDFWLKLFSLVMAVLLWFTVNIAVQKETSPLTLIHPSRRVLSSLPITVLTGAGEVRSFRVNPKEVEVTVQGDAKTVRGLQNKDVRVVLDLTGIEAAHDLKKSLEVTAPAGVTPVLVDPDEVQVVFTPKN
jgi:YbbR domain-containing protein